MFSGQSLKGAQSFFFPFPKIELKIFPIIARAKFRVEFVLLLNETIDAG